MHANTLRAHMFAMQSFATVCAGPARRCLIVVLPEQNQNKVEIIPSCV